MKKWLEILAFLVLPAPTHDPEPTYGMRFYPKNVTAPEKE